MLIILVMFLLGIILGFIGAGGAGFVIALLTLLFHIPIHTALGTSLAGMAFTSLSGAYSHYREGNIQNENRLNSRRLCCGWLIFRAKLTSFIPADLLHYLTAGMLFLSAILILIRLFILKEKAQVNQSTLSTYTRAVILGIAAGVLSAHSASGRHLLFKSV
ncbi:TSUP family transporter [Bacillus subtilis]|uniref:TSUP family transporter n=1 Tax=Bacillus subtilis TaxID=1423 RepID=UPI003D1FBFCA